MRSRRIFCLTGVATMAGVAAPRIRLAAAEREAFAIIVHPGNPASSISRRFLEDAFLKKTTRWSDENTIRPVDLHGGSAIRREFTRNVLNRTVDAVKNYWQQRIFSGVDVPPPEVESDEAVVEFVIRNRGAVGYVSASTIAGRAKLVTVR